MGTTRIRAAIYTRISQDSYADDPARAGSGVTRQREDCEKLCAGRGWTVGAVYTDNDVSAYTGRRRPGYEAMCADLEAGKVNAVVVWHLDRLHRRPIELEQFMDLSERRGVKLATVTGDVDLGTDSGRLHARIMGAVARAESERKSVRTVRANQQRAEQGRRGSNTRAFGHDGGRVVAAEARVIREATRRVLAGETLAAIVRDLAARGVTTITGKPFASVTLKRVLCSARISGRREYIPAAEYLGKGKARPWIGPIVAESCDWKPIISVDDSERLRALLTEPARRLNDRHGGQGHITGRPPSTLLSGFLRCKRCGRPMYSRPKQGQPAYQCIKVPGRGGCDRTSVTGWRVDEQVTDELLDRLATVGLAGVLVDEDTDPDLIQRVRQAEERLSELAAAYADGEITRAEWAAARKRLAARLDDDRAELARGDAARALDTMSGCGTLDDYAARWDGLTVGQRRAVLGALIDHIEVDRGGRGGHWNPERIRIIWRAGRG